MHFQKKLLGCPSPDRWLPLPPPPPPGAASRAEAAAEHEPRRPSGCRRPRAGSAGAFRAPGPSVRPPASEGPAWRGRPPPPPRSSSCSGGPRPDASRACRPRRPAAPPGPARHARPGRGQSGPGLRRGEQPEEPRVLGLRSPRPELGVKPPPAAPRANRTRRPLGLGAGREARPRPHVSPASLCPPGLGPRLSSRWGEAWGQGWGRPFLLKTLGFLWDGKTMADLLSLIKMITSWFENLVGASIVKYLRPLTSPTMRGWL